MIKIAVTGVNGRMGSTILQLVQKQDDLELSAAIVRVGNPLIGTRLPDSNCEFTHDLYKAQMDVVIDFTLPDGVMQHILCCVQRKVPMVIGTTGFSEQQLNQIKEAATQIPIVQSYNMSIGVNLFYKLIADAARMFDTDWQLEIHDVHHQHKKDIPSGTAKELAKIIVNNSNRNLNDIKILSERRGDAVGIHSVVFATPEESIMLFHHAQTRDIFANGAIRAAKWIVGKAPGLYSMQDVVSELKE